MAPQTRAPSHRLHFQKTIYAESAAIGSIRSTLSFVMLEYFERAVSKGLIVPGSFEYPEVCPDSQKRADTSAQEMENLMDIVHLEKFMERIVDHFDLL